MSSPARASRSPPATSTVALVSASPFRSSPRAIRTGLSPSAWKIDTRPDRQTRSPSTSHPGRPRNTNRCPENGSRFRTSCANAARPLNPLRMSVTPAARHTFVDAGDRDHDDSPRINRARASPSYAPVSRSRWPLHRSISSVPGVGAVTLDCHILCFGYLDGQKCCLRCSAALRLGRRHIRETRLLQPVEHLVRVHIVPTRNL